MSANRITYMDFAKGYAIFTIVIFHIMLFSEVPELFKKLSFFGGTGVHLFFLLSGFGLGMSGSKLEPLQFYKRRASKIWLPYVLILTISWAFAGLLHVYKDGLQEWLAGVGLYQMFNEEWVRSFGGHFWFISAIMQFYIAFPLIQYLFNKSGENKAPAVFGAFVVSVLWWCIVFAFGKSDFRIWNSFFLQFCWEFVLGMALAAAYKAGKTLQLGPIRLRGDFWSYPLWANLVIGIAASVLMLFMALKMGAFGKTFNDIPALIGYAALSIVVYQIGEKYFTPIKSFFLWIGSFSFSLYLVHMLGLNLYIMALKALQIENSLLMTLLYIPIALLLGRAFEPLSNLWTESVGGLLFGNQSKQAKS